MNLKDIRTAVLSQADWAPTESNDAMLRVNAFINRAYFQLAQEAPFLFFEDTVHFVTTADYDATAATDLIGVVATDPWVMQRGINAAVVATTTGASLWGQTTATSVDPRFWDGRMVEITDPNGIVHRRRVREFFSRDIGEDKFECFTLYRPWNNVTQTGMSYRFYDEAYYMPDDVIEVNSIKLHKTGQAWPLEIVGQMEAEQLSFEDVPDKVPGGVPRVAYRRNHFQLDSPTIAPNATATSKSNLWTGPQYAGSFQYRYTYCWGYRDPDFWNYGPETDLSVNNTTGARYEPKWESAPSPACSAVETTNVGPQIDLEVPSPDWIMGFGHSNDVRFSYSGFYVRVYRQRLTADTTTATTTWAKGTPNSAVVETVGEFFPVADLALSSTPNSLIFGDNGTVLPDYHRRLREVHGYQALALYPRPDDRYEVDVRCIRRPRKLSDDSDAPRIHLDAADCLIEKSLVLLYEAQGNPELADRAESKYQSRLFSLTKRYGDLRYPGQPMLKRPARAKRVVDTRKPWRRWYNLP